MAQSLRFVRDLGIDVEFENRHKVAATHFTRKRKLPFQNVLQLLLRKGVKSLQSVLNEWIDLSDKRITASALSQARKKFRHTAFIELQEKAVIDVMYGDGQYKKFRGHRLLALDATSLRLPKAKETIERFGEISHRDSSKRLCGNQVEAKATVLYDALNDTPISAELHPGRMHDLPASRGHLQKLKKGDIIIMDRGYVSYPFFAEILANNADFIARCRCDNYERYHKLFHDSHSKEVIVTIPAPKKIPDGYTVPEQMRIRFVRIVLKSGEVEVLATSLLDTNKFPHRVFKPLYYERWDIETYFQTLKSRLSIDNFTGKSVEAIYQDFYSTIFVSGLETILRADADRELMRRNTKLKYKVNKAVSFNTIKDKVIASLFIDIPDLEEQLTAAFLQNPISIRPKRKKIRLKRDNSVKSRASAYFQKCARKHAF